MLEMLAQILHQRKAQEMPQISDPEMVEAPPMTMPPMAPPQMPMPRPQRPDAMTTTEQDRINMLEGQRDQMGQPRQEGLLMQLFRGAGEGIVHGDRLPQVRQQQEQLKRQKMLDLANEAERVRSGVRQRGQDQLQVEASNRAMAAEDRAMAADTRDAQMDPVRARLLEAQTKGAERSANAPLPTENIDPLSDQGVKARIEFEKGKPGTQDQSITELDLFRQQFPQGTLQDFLAMKAKFAPERPAPAQRNIDPLSPEGIKAQQSLAESKETAKTANAGQMSPYTKERNTRALADIEDARKLVNGWTTGMGAEALAKLGGTDARQLQGKLNTLKASIMQNELAQMRQSSKTGGALGQVSDREGKLLESSLAAFDQGLSGKALLEELDKAKGSIERWTKEMEKAPQQPAGGGGKAPQGVDQAVWDVMTPQERALWQN